VVRLRSELAEWIPQYLIGNVWPLCKSHAQLFIGCLATPPFPRSRSWVCPRCEKSNLECLPDPTPGGSNAEIITPNPPERIPEVEVIQLAKGGNPNTAVSDHPPSPSSQEHSEESLPAATLLVPQTAVPPRSPVGNPRPPLLLDTAICVLLVLAFALLFRRFT